VKTLVAVAQMTSTDNKNKNLEICEGIIAQAAQKGARFVCFPENFAYFGNGKENIEVYAEDLEGPSLTRMRQSAKKHNIWVSLGGFQELSTQAQKIHNTHVILNNHGNLVAKYRKIHLFSANLPDGSRYNENRVVIEGKRPVLLETPFFKAGLSICYDLRFAHLFWALRRLGAQVMLVPAAFTKYTGQAHWEILLRTRAVETQSYVLAAAQVGQHNPSRESYGHAMIVDPWGRIIAKCKDKQDLALGHINLNYVLKLREQMPIQQHWRALS